MICPSNAEEIGPGSHVTARDSHATVTRDVTRDVTLRHSDGGVMAAASWLATEKSPPHPIVPEIRQRFGLTLSEAVAAVREATLIKGRAS